MEPYWQTCAAIGVASAVCGQPLACPPPPKMFAKVDIPFKWIFFTSFTIYLVIVLGGLLLHVFLFSLQSD